MQTFLPYSSFKKSAKVLDNKRLGKQRVENLQIMKVLTGLSGGWKNHPAVKMWKGYEKSLLLYQMEICLEWCNRGFKDTCLDKTISMLGLDTTSSVQPPWLGNKDFHLSHISNLLRKDYSYYSEKFSDVNPLPPPTLEYIWPTH
jgi:hypothetical protein